MVEELPTVCLLIEVTLDGFTNQVRKTLLPPSGSDFQELGPLSVGQLDRRPQGFSVEGMHMQVNLLAQWESVRSRVFAVRREVLYGTKGVPLGGGGGGLTKRTESWS